MIVATDRNTFTYLSTLCLILVLFMAAGCAHIGKDAPGASEAKKLMETSSTSEKQGDVINAVQDLKIARAIDPGNRKTLDELNRLIEKRDREAELLYKAGVAVRNSNATEARRDFLAALRIRSDYPEAITALRELHYAKSEAVIQARLKKEAARAGTRSRVKVQVDEDELDPDSYSLDGAVSALEEGDYATATREFEKMKLRYPDDPDIKAYLDLSWYNSGIAFFKKKDYKKALSSFAKVRKGFESVDDYISRCKQALKKR